MTFEPKQVKDINSAHGNALIYMIIRIIEYLNSIYFS